MISFMMLLALCFIHPFCVLVFFFFRISFSFLSYCLVWFLCLHQVEMAAAFPPPPPPPPPLPPALAATGGDDASSKRSRVAPAPAVSMFHLISKSVTGLVVSACDSVERCNLASVSRDMNAVVVDPRSRVVGGFYSVFARTHPGSLRGVTHVDLVGDLTEKKQEQQYVAILQSIGPTLAVIRVIQLVTEWQMRHMTDVLPVGPSPIIMVNVMRVEASVATQQWWQYQVAPKLRFLPAQDPRRICSCRCQGFCAWSTCPDRVGGKCNRRMPCKPIVRRPNRPLEVILDGHELECQAASIRHFNYGSSYCPAHSCCPDSA